LLGSCELVSENKKRGLDHRTKIYEDFQDRGCVIMRELFQLFESGKVEVKMGAETSK
jgi:hypothetical protein